MCLANCISDASFCIYSGRCFTVCFNGAFADKWFFGNLFIAVILMMHSIICNSPCSKVEIKFWFHFLKDLVLLKHGF